MQMNRRAFLSAAGIGALSVGAAGCSNIDWTQVQTAWNSFVDNVTQLVAAGCNTVQGFIPTVATIAEAVAALYGAGAEQFVAGIAGAVNQTATSLCAAISGPKPASFRQRLALSSEAAPIIIGTVTVTPVNGGPPTPVVVHGYSVRAGARRHYGNVYRLYEEHKRQADSAYHHTAPQTRQWLDRRFTRPVQ